MIDACVSVALLSQPAKTYPLVTHIKLHERSIRFLNVLHPSRTALNIYKPSVSPCAFRNIFNISTFPFIQ